MNTGDRRSTRSCPRAYSCCKAVANRPFPDALRFPCACRPCQQGGTCLSPNCASLTTDAGSFPKPCCKGGVVFRGPGIRLGSPTSYRFPAFCLIAMLAAGNVAFGPLLPSQVFACGSARTRLGRCGSMHVISSLRQPPTTIFIIVLRQGRGIFCSLPRDKPPSSTRPSSEIHPCTPTPFLRFPHPAAAELQRSARHDALPFRPLRLDRPRAALSPRTFRLAFPQEGGRTPHSRQQVILSAPGPWALRGIPLHAAMACTLTQRTRSVTE